MCDLEVYSWEEEFFILSTLCEEEQAKEKRRFWVHPIIMKRGNNMVNLSFDSLTEEICKQILSVFSNVIKQSL